MIWALGAGVKGLLTENALDPAVLPGLEGSGLGAETDCKERRASAEFECRGRMTGSDMPVNAFWVLSRAAAARLRRLVAERCDREKELGDGVLECRWWWEEAGRVVRSAVRRSDVDDRGAEV